MMRIKFIGSLLQFKNGKVLLQERCAFPQISCSSRYSIDSKRSKTEKKDDAEEVEQPIKFSTSNAAKLRMKPEETEDQQSWQPAIVILSVAIFMLYFCVLREENDIDEKMIKDIPPEILEQIYGKNYSKTAKKL